MQDPRPVPAGATAQRLEWSHLPRQIRDAIAERCGDAVITAGSCGAGFTPGFASVLTCADGSRHFVKAASWAAQPASADSYAHEARVSAALNDHLSAPNLRWTLNADHPNPGTSKRGWLAIGFEYVEARAPGRPWSPGDLSAALDACEQIADVVDPLTAEAELAPIGPTLHQMAGLYERLRNTRSDVPNLAEAAELADLASAVCSGETLVHQDLRDDNTLIRPDGTAVFCDWTWPERGAAWLDSVMLLIGAAGDGLDVEPVLDSRRLTAEVDSDHVDAFLAAMTGYLAVLGDQPDPATSPYLRAHQRWFANAAWGWLAARRGWKSSAAISP